MSSTRQYLRTGREYRIVLWDERTRETDTEVPVVILSHGIGTSHENPLIAVLAKRLLAHGYEVVRYDLAGHGQSGGGIKDRLVTNFINDLADVVSWCTERRKADRRGVILIGHSIGALSTLLVAHRIRQLRGVVLIGCNAQAKKKFHELMAKGKVRKLARYWIIGRAKVALGFWKDRFRLEPERFAKKITAPVLVVCGTNDVTNPPADSRTLFRWLKGPKELRLIPGTDHYFREQRPRKLISQHILRWLDRLIK